MKRKAFIYTATIILYIYGLFSFSTCKGLLDNTEVPEEKGYAYITISGVKDGNSKNSYNSSRTITGTFSATSLTDLSLSGTRIKDETGNTIASPQEETIFENLTYLEMLTVKLKIQAGSWNFILQGKAGNTQFCTKTTDYQNVEIQEGHNELSFTLYQTGASSGDANVKINVTVDGPSENRFYVNIYIYEYGQTRPIAANGQIYITGNANTTTPVTLYNGTKTTGNYMIDIVTGVDVNGDFLPCGITSSVLKVRNGADIEETINLGTIRATTFNAYFDEYTITPDAYNGSAQYGGKVYLPPLSQAGMVFKGWYYHVAGSEPTLLGSASDGFKFDTKDRGNYAGGEVRAHWVVTDFSAMNFARYTEASYPAGVTFKIDTAISNINDEATRNKLSQFAIDNPGVSYVVDFSNTSHSLGFGSGIFENCTNLKKLIIGQNISGTIHSKFVTGSCASDFEFELTEGCTSYDISDDKQMLFSIASNKATLLCDSLAMTEDSTIQNSLREIPVTTKNGTTVYSIAAEVYSGSTLRQFHLPKFLNEIKEKAFANTTLDKINIPSSVQNIEKGVFYNVTSEDPKVIIFNPYRWFMTTSETEYTGKSGGSEIGTLSYSYLTGRTDLEDLYLYEKITDCASANALKEQMLIASQSATYTEVALRLSEEVNISMADQQYIHERLIECSTNQIKVILDLYLSTSSISINNNAFETYYVFNGDSDEGDCTCIKYFVFPSCQQTVSAMIFFTKLETLIIPASVTKVYRIASSTPDYSLSFVRFEDTEGWQKKGNTQESYTAAQMANTAKTIVNNLTHGTTPGQTSSNETYLQKTN